MTSSLGSIRQCQTCGQIHPSVPGMYWKDCVLIGGRARGRADRRGLPDNCPPSDHLTTIPMPTSIREQAILFDQIWFWFVDMKHENDDVRDQLSMYSVNKGTLRSAAPLLWLEWKRWGDVRGQTRNQENFDKAWKNFVHFVDGYGRKMPVAWLTLRSMPPNTYSPPLAPATPMTDTPRFITT